MDKKYKLIKFSTVARSQALGFFPDLLVNVNDFIKSIKLIFHINSLIKAQMTVMPCEKKLFH